MWGWAEASGEAEIHRVPTPVSVRVAQNLTFIGALQDAFFGRKFLKVKYVGKS